MGDERELEYIHLALEDQEAFDDSEKLNDKSTDAETIVKQPQTGQVAIVDPAIFTLEKVWSLTDENQVVIHKYNLRRNETINEEAEHKYEIIDVSKKILMFVERMPAPYDFVPSFCYRFYSRDRKFLIEMINPNSNLFMCLGTSCSPCQRCNFKSVVYCPPGNIIGYIVRQRSCCLQEFELLNSENTPLLTIKGCPRDFQVYPPNLEGSLGRISGRWWRGIMHEIRRSENDLGVTFPLDLDIRVKILLICSAFCIDWIYPEHNTSRHRWQEGEAIPKTQERSSNAE